MLVNAREGNMSVAKAYSQSLIEKDPTNLTSILTFINITIAQENTDTIEPFLESIIDKQPLNQAPIIGLSLFYAWQKQPNKSLALLQQKADSKNSQVLKIKGDIYRSQMKYDEAYVQYEIWHKTYPRDPAAWFNTLELLQTMNNNNKALIVSTEALKYFPNEPRLKGLNAMLLAQSGKVQEARKQFSSIQQDANALPTLSFFNGEILLKEKKYPEAKKILLEYYNMNPTFETAKPLAFAMQELGQSKEGGKILENELDKLSNPFIEAHSVAEYFADNNMLNEAEAHYDALLNRYPQDYITINNYASVLISKGELDKAAELVRVAMQLQPNSGFSLDLFGWLQFNQGKINESLLFFMKALEQTPHNIEMRMHLVDNYIALNRIAEAKKLISEITPITKAQSRYFNALKNKL